MTIGPDLWRRARPLLDRALELPEAERTAFVAETTRSDPELGEALTRLLAAAADEAPFLESLDAGTLGLLGADPAGAVGRRLGPYELIRLLGAGGMGAVYLARRADGEFEQRVAVKVIRSGPLDASAVARFRRERQILAWLDHPHIARLLDGGVDEAGPYLVMEYVEGEPIDQYCDRHGLGVPDRIRVFLAVCDAVEYAHRNLIVHRDLKPGNILVTESGQVKLLDFGIARLLDDEPADGAVTETGTQLLTRDYASPEQIRGGPITTASDGYALGVVLYQLLTGRLPHDTRGMSPAALEHEVTEVAPPRPSSLRRELSGDLDTILLQALRPDPARRYGTAAALADDLRRHLERRPVSARPDTLGYRLSRFVRRNALAVGAATVLLVSIVGGALATMYQGARAERRFQSVRALANALLSDLHDAVRELPGATATRELLVSHALNYLDELRTEVPTDPDLLLELAAAYEQIGEIQGDPHRSNLGDLEGALQSYQTALKLRERVWTRDTSNASVRHLLGTSYGHLAVAMSWSGRNDEAIVLSRRAIELIEPVVRNGAAATVVGGDLGRIESELGWWLVWNGRVDEGLNHLDRGTPLLTRAVRPGNTDPDPAIDLWRAYSYRLDALRFSGRVADAFALLRDEALPFIESLAERHPGNQAVQYELSVGYDFLGTLNQGLGRLPDAARAYRRAEEVAGGLVRADSADQRAFEGLARSHTSLGQVLVRSGRVAEAIASFEEGVRIFTRMAERNPRNSEFANMLGNTYRGMCDVQRRHGLPSRALESCLAGERALERAVAMSEAYAIARANLASNYVQTARVYRTLAEGAEPQAAERYREYARSRFGDGLRLLRELATAVDAELEFHPDSVAAELASLPERQ